MASNGIARRLRPRPPPLPPARSKRAALDEHGRPSLSQHAKKRAALTDLTNLPASKSQGAAVPVPATRGKSRVVAKSRDVEANQAFSVEALPKSDGGEPDSATASEASSNSFTFENDENAPPGGKRVSLEAKSESVEAVPKETTASLERKALHNLSISNDSNPRIRQGFLLDENLVGEGWFSKNYADIDNDHNDPQMCSSYATDIYRHLRIAELKRRPATDIMETVQQDINASMRGILVDWLVEVAEEYKLVPDTLYLTVSYIDRFLSGNVVNRQRLQLLGVSCMLIASKYEEICAPQVEEFCYITDNTYAREEVLEMERQVLNYLHFELAGPTTKSFLRRFIRAAQAGQKTPTLHLEFLGNYLAELTLVEYSFLQYLPSMIAGAAVFMAKATLNPTVKPWNSTLQHYSGYRPSELHECVKAIHELQCNKDSTLPAIREKYRQHKFKCVANLAPPASIPLDYFNDSD